MRVTCRYESTREYCRDYLCTDDGVPDLEVQVSDQELAHTLQAVPGIDEPWAEFTALYRPLARFLPEKNGFVIHGASIHYGGRAYLFTAPSGTGKTTHIRLWKRYLGQDVGIVNGDKPVITVGSEVQIHGTPWAGKERWQRNLSFPLAGICLVNRGMENKVEKVSADAYLPFLLGQLFFGGEAPQVAKTMELLDATLSRVPVYRMECDMSRQAVECSFEALTGQKFPNA